MAPAPLKALLMIPSVHPGAAGEKIGLGGTERMTLNLLSRFDRSLIEPHLLLFHDPGPQREMLDALDVPVHILPKRGRVDFALWSAMGRLIRVQKFDAVLSMLQGTNLHNLMVTPRIPGVACLISYRGGVVRRNFAMTEGLLAGRAQRLIAPAESVVSQLRQSYRIPDDRVIQIPNGCDADRFTVQDKEAQMHARRELGIPQESMVLYTPSRVQHAKGQDMLAAALAGMQKLIEDKDVIWINTGQNQDQDLLEQIEAETAGSDGRVRLLGPVERPEDYYAACDLVVLPSRIEAFSNVLLEAAFSGRPFIATAVGETPVVQRNLQGGWVCEPTIDGLTTVIKPVLSSHDRNKLMQAGEAMAARAAEMYSLRATAARFAEEIAAAVALRRGHSA